MTEIKGNNEDVSFAALILPDGSLYQANSSHLWVGHEHYFLTNIYLLLDFFEKNPNYTKEQLNDVINGIMIFDEKDKLVNLTSEYFRNLVLSEHGKEKIIDLNANIELIDRNNKKYKDDNKNPENQGYFFLKVTQEGNQCALYFKDILVSALGCHYISRKTNAIVTSARNYKELFAKEIQSGCSVNYVPRLEYYYDARKFVLPSDSLRFHTEALIAEENGEKPNMSYYDGEFSPGFKSKLK